MEGANEDLRYLDPETNEKYLPYVIEPSVGVDRLLLAVLCDSYHVEKLENDERVVLKLHPALAPIKVTILPLVKKYHSEKANDIYGDLCSKFSCSYDDTGSIGKRYRRCDAVGTPFCLTIDDETLKEDIVTIRDRDTMEQIKIKLEDVEKYIIDKIAI